MEFRKESAPISLAKVDVTLLGIFSDENVRKLLSKLDKKLDQDFLDQISEACRQEAFEGKSGQVLSLPTYGGMHCRKLVLWGLGSSKDYKPATTRKFAANAVKRLNSAGVNESVHLVLRSKSDQSAHLQAAVEGFILGAYAFHKYKSRAKDEREKKKVLAVTVSGDDLSAREFNESVTAGEAIASATNFARDLIAEPAGFMTPTKLAAEARRVSKECNLQCTVLERADMEKNGMGALLGVAQGASAPPKFIVLKYTSAKAKKTVALVGKGITFDSGGLSLKPAQSMEHMKYDMSGAAAVIAVMQAVGRLKPKVNVIGLVAATENMPGGRALHPGDVLVSANGKTIEVNNTDAEGRLVLADALTYALKQEPDEIVDIATLTGGIVTALGRAAAGVMGNDSALVVRLIQSAEQAGEKLWQMPLFDEYKDYLKSDIADLKNAGSRGEAASSAGGMFLKEFVDGKPWAHLDIAGPGWMDKEKDENNKGGTAFGVRTLCRYVLSLS